MSNFNPLAPCGARRHIVSCLVIRRDISIHSPRAGRDHRPAVGGLAADHFNPLAPCGARLESPCASRSALLFQSTRPVRGETKSCGEFFRRFQISIHSPRAGRDPSDKGKRPSRLTFQSTRPVRGETACPCVFSHSHRISIHSPRAGRDCAIHIKANSIPDFNPLAPCGARRRSKSPTATTSLFQSTRPVRGETGKSRRAGRAFQISIHSPRAGRDETRPLFPPPNTHFNPLAPCGARLKKNTTNARRLLFQSTRPVRGETLPPEFVEQLKKISIHSPRAGRDLISQRSASRTPPFQSTRPVRGETAKAYKIHEIVLYVFHKIIGTSARIKESTDAYALKVPAFTVRSQPDFLHRFHIAPHLILSTHLQRHKTALLRCVESFQNNDSPDCRSGVNLARGLSAFLACV